MERFYSPCQLGLPTRTYVLTKSMPRKETNAKRLSIHSNREKKMRSRRKVTRGLGRSTYHPWRPATARRPGAHRHPGNSKNNSQRPRVEREESRERRGDAMGKRRMRERGQSPTPGAAPRSYARGRGATLAARRGGRAGAGRESLEKFGTLAK